MYNPFKPLEHITTEVFTSLPAKFRKKSRSAWSDPNRQNAEVECFLEGPAFDREGNLWVCDIPFGRIFRIDPKGNWDLVIQYDGWPNGMKFHKDGRLFICDYKEGLLTLDPKTGKLENVLRTATNSARAAFTGVNFGLTQVQALESAERSARTQLDSTRLGYQVGVRIQLDVLNATTQLVATQRDLKRARYDFLISGLNLKAAAGSLAEDDLQAFNRLLTQ